jgi:hypothetical protein
MTPWLLIIAELLAMLEAIGTQTEDQAKRIAEIRKMLDDTMAEADRRGL